MNIDRPTAVKMMAASESAMSVAIRLPGAEATGLPEIPAGPLLGNHSRITIAVTGFETRSSAFGETTFLVVAFANFDLAD